MTSTTMNTAMELSFWKEEPLSPVFSGLEADQADVWQLFEDDVAKTAAHTPERDPLDDLGNRGDWLPDSPGDSCDSLESHSCLLNARAQLASQLLQDLDDVLIKEEPFSDWYETKTDLPMFEELPSPTKEEARPFASLSYPAFTPAAPAAVHVPLSVVQPEAFQHTLILPMTAPAAPIAAPAATIAAPVAIISAPMASPVDAMTDTQTLLQEFESVFGKVEQSHGALTPPQSPPHDMNTNTTATFHRLAAPAPQLTHLPQPLQLLPHEDFSGGMTPNPQLIAEVDEIVRCRVESWPDCPRDLRPPSPCTSSNSSFSSEDAASSTSPLSPETDDPEWSPSDSAPEPAPGKATRKRGSKRSKPYGHTVEDKKLRKKEQNKNAATRYRMKKKAEVEVILGEENELKEHNEQLQAKVQDLSQEIRYLKNLMRDVFRAKGLIK